MQKVFKAYMGRPWPPKSTKKRASSTDKNLPRCGADCTCSLYAECQQNAAAYISAAEYSKEHPEAIDTNLKPNEKIKRQTRQCTKKHRCAAMDANHRVSFIKLKYAMYP